MISYASQHHKDCDWHVDQYPFECNCGVYNQEQKVTQGMTTTPPSSADKRPMVDPHLSLRSRSTPPRRPHQGSAGVPVVNADQLEESVTEMIEDCLVSHGIPLYMVANTRSAAQAIISFVEANTWPKTGLALND